MSKVGEGDPRWLVKNREDGKNVNHWHWEEKDMFSWAKDKLISLFTDAVVIDDEKMKIIITEVEDMNGVFTVNNRKAKLIYIWDFNLKLYWKGQMKETGAEGSGRIDCVDINVTDDSYDVYVSLDQETSSNAPLRNYLKSNAFKFTKSIVDLMINEMKEYIGDKNQTDTSKKTENNFETLQSKILFHNVNPSYIYSILTEKNMVAAFTGSESTISKNIGSTFELYGGNINGKIELLKKDEIIRQKWRVSKWKKGHYSDVKIKLESHDNHCLLTLEQQNVPKNEIEQTMRIWEESYWMRIMAIYGILYEKK